MKSDADGPEETSLLRISARSGKTTNYNEDDRYLGMISESEEDQIPAYASQPTVAIGGGLWLYPTISSSPVSNLLTRGIIYFTVLKDEGDAIDAVLDHMKDSKFPEPEHNDPTQHLLYLIKWQGYSHLHATWESYEFAKQYRGLTHVFSITVANQLSFHFFLS